LHRMLALICVSYLLVLMFLSGLCLLLVLRPYPNKHRHPHSRQDRQNPERPPQDKASSTAIRTRRQDTTAHDTRQSSVSWSIPLVTLSVSASVHVVSVDKSRQDKIKRQARSRPEDQNRHDPTRTPVLSEPKIFLVSLVSISICSSHLLR
jgi:hypothetical protein